MWPGSHAAIGYLTWSAIARYRAGRPPTTKEFWVVILASQLPDLIDKPLAWSFGVLPAGRSVAHSLLTAALLGAVAIKLARRWDQTLVGVAFTISYTEHLLADTVSPLLDGRFAYTHYLLWPLLPMPPYDTERSIIEEFAVFPVDSLFDFRVLFVVITLIIWWLDGMPGIPAKWSQRW